MVLCGEVQKVVLRVDVWDECYVLSELFAIKLSI